MEHQVNTSRDASARETFTILYVEAIVENLRLRRKCGKFFAASIVGGTVVTIHKPGSRSHECAGADRNECMAWSNSRSQPFHNCCLMNVVRLGSVSIGLASGH